MALLIDQSLDWDRVDVCTTNEQRPFDLVINMLCTTKEYVTAASSFVTGACSIFTTEKQRPKVQCIAHAIDRNAMTVVVTGEGWRRWTSGIVNATGNPSAMCDQFAQDVLGVLRHFLEEYRAEGTMAKTATCDIFFPCGRHVHWAGIA